jgi:hypothetical protein
MALPVPAVGPGQALVHEPQCAGSDGSTHAPEQLSDVDPLHPRPQVPFVQVAWPEPVSGPEHALSQLPQCVGCVGSTHVPLQSSEVGGEQLLWALSGVAAESPTPMMTSDWDGPSLPPSLPPSGGGQ